MKNIFTLLAAVLLTATTYAQIGINNENPDASAALDITSTTGGLLTPRMTAAQRDAITTPSQGLIIFCTDCASGEGELQIKLSSAWKNLPVGDVNDPPPAIGDTYQGGVVFYLDGSGGGLIAALSDQSSGIQWYNGTDTTTGATDFAIGAGSSNTDLIIASQGGAAGSYTYAAGVCADYTVDDGGVTYDDWFLPSLFETKEMATNKNILNAAAGFTPFSGFYWSSSENSGNKAWRENFTYVSWNAMAKSTTIAVRAVRAF
ncbi:MAG: hypothetical protein ACI9RL_000882 [Candidatus Paceibacteria bacterium]|jgi:hypothetical protein